MRRSAWRGLNRGNSAPNRSISYGDMERDIYSIAQQAVANGYGNNEYLRAHPTALSTRVRTAVSASICSCPNLESAALRFNAMMFSLPPTGGYNFYVVNEIRQSYVLMNKDSRSSERMTGRVVRLHRPTGPSTAVGAGVKSLPH